MKLQNTIKVWFPIEDDPDGTEFEIKHLRAGEISRIVEATHAQRFEFRKDEETGEIVPVPIMTISKIKEKELTIIRSVTNWKNMFDIDGHPLECTKANKIRLCQELSEENFTVLSQFVEEKRNILADQIKEQEKAALGN